MLGVGFASFFRFRFCPPPVLLAVPAMTETEQRLRFLFFLGSGWNRLLMRSLVRRAAAPKKTTTAYPILPTLA